MMQNGLGIQKENSLPDFGEVSILKKRLFDIALQRIFDVLVFCFSKNEKKKFDEENIEMS